MQVLRAADHRRMPWKNGGGETIEVAVSPAGAALEAFDWRLSMAHVATPGPFSIFDGVDRTLTVIAGAGITLRLAGRDPMRLMRDTPPFAFPGDVPADAELVAGAIDDLNVMTRRGRYRHAVSRLTGPHLLTRQGETTFVLAAQGDVRVKIGEESVALGPRDALRLDHHDPAQAEIAMANGGEAFVIALWPAAG